MKGCLTLNTLLQTKEMLSSNLIIKHLNWVFNVTYTNMRTKLKGSLCSLFRYQVEAHMPLIREMIIT